jgi:hypothetical protein
MDLIGKTFGRLTVVSRTDRVKNYTYWWHCDCSCGGATDVYQGNLVSGKIKSCGCLHKESCAATGHAGARHGLSNEPIYYVWRTMNARCYNRNTKEYRNYGARGISVCDEWLGDSGLLKFIVWARGHGYARGLALDRIDNNGNYCPENCRVVTPRENCNNTRKNRLYRHNGITRTLSQWSEERGIPYPRLLARLDKLHWDFEKAISTPKNYL